MRPKFKAKPYIERARKLRNNPSVAELVAWKLLQKQNLGYRFRRQHPFPPYTLDFYCHELKLCVEFDGEQHDPAVDAKRDAYLLASGVVTFRIPNIEFFEVYGPVQIDWILELEKFCQVRANELSSIHPELPPPSP